MATLASTRSALSQKYQTLPEPSSCQIRNTLYTCTTHPAYIDTNPFLSSQSGYSFTHSLQQPHTSCAACPRCSNEHNTDDDEHTNCSEPPSVKWHYLQRTNVQYTRSTAYQEQIHIYDGSDDGGFLASLLSRKLMISYTFSSTACSSWAALLGWYDDIPKNKLFMARNVIYN